jgi:hypothetical protein
MENRESRLTRRRAAAFSLGARSPSGSSEAFGGNSVSLDPGPQACDALGIDESKENRGALSGAETARTVTMHAAKSVSAALVMQKKKSSSAKSCAIVRCAKGRRAPRATQICAYLT